MRERCHQCREEVDVPATSQEQASEALDLSLLAKALKDPVPQTRCQAAELMGKLGDKDAIPFLIKAFRSPDRDTRDAVMQALRQIGDPKAIMLLLLNISGVWTSKPLIREATQELAKFGPLAATPLLKIIDSINNKDAKLLTPAAVCVAVTVLGHIADDNALEQITKLSRTYICQSVRDAALCAIVMIGAPKTWQDIRLLPESHMMTNVKKHARDILHAKHIQV